MSLLSRMSKLHANPGMLSAYARWIAARYVVRGDPRITVCDGHSIGGWMSFSEYWSFLEVISGEERAFVKGCIANAGGVSPLAIDVGANVGAFTILLASMGCGVHAFEPIPETFCRLKRNVADNDVTEQVQLNCIAVGEKTGLVRFQVNDASPATNRLSPSGKVTSGDYSHMQTIAAVSLDDYCGQLEIERIAFLKVDVEGMEPYVLRGARRLLSEGKIGGAMIEICPTNLASVGLSCSDLYRECEAVGRVPYALGEDGAPRHRLSLGDIESIRLINAVLIPEC